MLGEIECSYNRIVGRCPADTNVRVGGQNRKSSMRANVVRCSPNNGHRQDTAACLKRAARSRTYSYPSPRSSRPDDGARWQRSSFASCLVPTTKGYGADGNQQSCDRGSVSYFTRG